MKFRKLAKKKTRKEDKKVSAKPAGFKPKYVIAALFAFTFILYANTLGHDFTLDDAIVIKSNDFTQKGVKGIANIFTKDTFHGFFGEAGKDKLVKGGRYRPFTLAMFAVEKSVFGPKPIYHHLINILLYALIGIVVFLLSKLLFLTKFDKNTSTYIATGVAVLFIAHPLHTEAVANIKGRDEIVALLGSIFALYLLAKNRFEFSNWKLIGMAALSFFIALLSKENAITFLAVIPLAAYLFYDKSIVQSLKVTMPFLVATALFLVIRTAVIGWDMGADPSMELMNNPYLKIEDNRYVPFETSEKIATISFTLWKYVQLLIFPHPLTHDYYPNHIGVVSFLNPLALLGMISHLILLGLSIYGLIKRKIWSFFTSYYLITLSIVSNVVFPVGTHMSERFVFMPSLAFVMALAYFAFRILGNNSKKVAYIILGGIVVMYSLKTITRNTIWKDNFTLFTTDAITSAQSAKVNNAAGGTLMDSVSQMQDGPEKVAFIARAHTHLSIATKAHPNYVNAYLLRGNAFFYENKFDEAINQYQKCLRIDPSYEEASNNIFLTNRSAGRYFGEILNDLNSAALYLTRALEIRPNDFEANRLLGTCYGLMGNHVLASQHFKKCIELQPNNAGLYVNLARTYEAAGKIDESQAALAKAKSIDPGILNK